MREKEIEDLLVEETRIVRLPDNSMRRITMFKLGWRSYNILLNCGYWSEKDITGMIENDARLVGKSFEEYFPDAIGYMHSRLNQAYREYRDSQK